MADTTLRRLRDRLARLQGEAVRLQAQIEAYGRVIADLEQEDDPGRATTPAKALVNHMWRILEDAARPMHYRDIYQALLDRGVEIPGQDPLKNVGAHLSADPRFEKQGRGLWALASWRESGSGGKPLPAAVTAELSADAAPGELAQDDLASQDAATGEHDPPAQSVAPFRPVSPAERAFRVPPRLLETQRAAARLAADAAQSYQRDAARIADVQLRARSAAMGDLASAAREADTVARRLAMTNLVPKTAALGYVGGLSRDVRSDPGASK